jgi:hypothetical protein
LASSANAVAHVEISETNCIAPIITKDIKLDTAAPQFYTSASGGARLVVNPIVLPLPIVYPDNPPVTPERINNFPL